MRVWILIFSICTLHVHFGCEDNAYNDDLIPPNQQLSPQGIDTFTVNATVLRNDTVRTDVARYAALGKYFDPVFGKTTASFYATFTVAQPFIFGTNPTVDSVILALSFLEAYGADNKYKGLLRAEVYELLEEIPFQGLEEEGYTSFDQFQISSVPIGVTEFAPVFPASSAGDGKQLRIPINNAIGQEIVSVDSLTNDNLVNIIRGFYIAIDPNYQVTPSEGAISLFDLFADASQLTVYFKNQDSVNQQFEVVLNMNSSEKSRFNVFTHDYSTATSAFQDKLNNPQTSTVDLLYLQSGGGTIIKIDLPYLSNLGDSGLNAINKAELILPIEELPFDELYARPDQLIVYTFNPDGTENALLDLNATYYTGTFDANLNAYRIQLTQYVQRILLDEQSASAFYIDVPLGLKPYSPVRAVFHAPNHSTTPMKLNIVFTNLTD